MSQNFDLSAIEFTNNIFDLDINSMNVAKPYILALKEIVQSQTLIIKKLVEEVSILQGSKEKKELEEFQPFKNSLEGMKQRLDLQTSTIKLLTDNVNTLMDQQTKAFERSVNRTGAERPLDRARS